MADFDFALGLEAAGRIDEAASVFEEILATERDHVGALYHLGRLACRRRDFERGIQLLERVVALDANHARAHNDLGFALCTSGRMDRGISHLQRAVQCEPTLVEALLNLADALIYRGAIEEAAAPLMEVLRIAPDSAGVLESLGAIRLRQEQWLEAAAYYEKACKCDPGHASYYFGLGMAWAGANRLEEALGAFKQAIRLKPEYIEAHTQLGMALTSCQRLDEAVECFARALSLDRGDCNLWGNLGAAFKNVGEFEKGLECCEEALKLNGEFAPAWCNLGEIWLASGDPRRAVASVDRAIELEPNMVEAHLARAFSMLVQGKFEEGWSEYEWRHRARSRRVSRIAAREWSGEPLSGRTILLRAEQGLGDTLQFVRYAALVKARQARVVLECHTSLANLLARCPGVDQIAGFESELPPIDVQASLMSLPRIFQTRRETIPAAVPYLFADERLVALWRDRLARVEGFRIGINWQGRAGRGLFRQRDLPLAMFEQVAAIPGVRLISLQRGEGRDELLKTNLGNWSSNTLPLDLGDDVDQAAGAFMDTAAVMKNLDLVITSDTSIAHLAGALAIPVWVALPYVPDWRWLLDRIDSPWYPTMRLFRQKSRGDWSTVIQEITAALMDRLAR